MKEDEKNQKLYKKLCKKNSTQDYLLETKKKKIALKYIFINQLQLTPKIYNCLKTPIYIHYEIFYRTIKKIL